MRGGEGRGGRGGGFWCWGWGVGVGRGGGICVALVAFMGGWRLGRKGMESLWEKGYILGSSFREQKMDSMPANGGVFQSALGDLM